MTLAQRVRDYRYSKGWGPDELANRAAISRTALYQIESGKTELPRAGTLRRIAIALEVSMESLLGHPEGPAGHDAAGAASVPSARKGRGDAEWIPAEGGPLAVPPSRAMSIVEAADPSRFAVETAPPLSKMHDLMVTPRERELAWKLHELLTSPLGEGVARIIEETYRLLPHARSSI
jgi:transcriptional regulator with XRE-family HTH domain